jgi:hypothetical protein
MNTLQLISHTLKFSLIIPDNVYLFFDTMNDLLNMRSKYLQDWLDQMLDKVITIKRDENGEEQSIMKNLGTMFVAIIALAFLVIIAIGLSILVKYVSL